ncbi:CGLD27 family protein [Gloeobacter violaceus]|uniref:Ycf36 protein n=1 Tax=Gloeobacter violaceus (strain ATCC 29082 / PCC 7421) TaxID=251221 RepID=Q7NMB7_GLOVI|nr:CGLD27 family protein [Gloeobacter violaceus]BAC88790.1 ycf36 [Gloeobacter violaceus PCC 7421]
MERRTPTVAIPPEQRPFNEYQQLRSSYFFRWATVEPRVYLGTILAVWSVAWIVSGPVAAWSFPPGRMPWQFLVGGAGGAGIILGLVLLRLYLGWSYVHTRLLSASVHYEETGWYDGSFWTKPAEDLAKDRLVVEYQVAPVMRRLRRTLAALALFYAVEALLCWLM